jgi:hypothetical protein
MVLITIKPDVRDYMNCSLCDKFFQYKHYKVIDGYDVVDLDVYCKKCRLLVERKYKLQAELTDVEYEIFSRQK